MVALPFIYFSWLLILSVKRKGFDVYSYLLLLFVITSFFSILFVRFNLYSSSSVPSNPIGLIGPIVYCILITICLQPFRYFDSNRIRYLIDNINIKAYNIIVYVFWGMFILLLIISITQIQNIVSAQNLAAMRNDFYNGDSENVWSRFQGWERYLIGGISLIAGTCRVLIIFFFINIIYLKKSVLFNFMTLLGSMSSLILSFYILDRSGFVHWIMLFCLFLVLFRKQITYKMVRPYLIFALPILAIIIIYFVAVTVSRFGEQSGGNTWDGLIVYAGQSYLNFCNFFNNLGDESPFSLQPLFPLTYKLLGLPDYFEQCGIVEHYYHHGVSNFSTFLGVIVSISGKIVMFLFVFLYYAICNLLLKRKNKSSVSLRKLIFFLIVGLVPANGIFAYPYYNYAATIVIVLWVFIASYVTKKSDHSSEHKFNYLKAKS